MDIEYNDMAKKKSTKNWLNRHSRDVYVKLSQSGDYRSRAFHKLHEINEKYRILKTPKNILDLGSAPGSWSEYISRNFDNKNLVAIDQLEMKPIKSVYFIKGDINEKADREKIFNKMSKADLVLSDIAPNITGIEDVDQANFEKILESILDICFDLLKTNGVLVMKFFIGSSYDLSRKKLKIYFDTVATYKPDSSRSTSNEIFFVCNGFKD
jgi:23S rRNA (uridine2552-2'-O)-methyltransferase